MKTREFKNRKSVAGYMLLLAILTFVYTGCSKDETDNEGEFVPVTSITGISTVAEVNKPLTLDATVSPANATNKAIKWTIKNAGTTRATISNGNTLTAEAAGTADITATIDGGTTQTSPFTADFSITVKNAVEMPTVASVEVSPATVAVVKGDSLQFTATVTGNKLEEADKTVIWTVTGGAKPATAITADGKLTVDEGETASSLTVKATSTLDNLRSGTANVTLTDKPKDARADYFGTWRSVPENGYWEQITLASDEIVWVNTNGSGFTINDPAWTETDNTVGNNVADYPAGYKVTGIITSINGYTGIPKADGSGTCTSGDLSLISYYLHTDKKSIRIGNFKTAGQEAYYGPYNPETDVEYWQVSWELNGGAWPASDNHVTQVVKDGKLAYPAAPTKAGNTFDGWYKDSSLSNRVSFPYDMSDVTGNFTLYAKWTDSTPSAKLSVTKSPGAGFYTSISVQVRNANGEWGAYKYRISNGGGTEEINVVPGTYRLFVTYWSCPYVSCMSSGWSSSFSVSSGQTRKISIVGSAVGV
ncbi:MAG: InlB B-repeat-containing protein [Tannerellaceae bacterium]|jgi:uncharacterized repeat protein (TIGR02543 family)|nr:InlB B-repeat-containing protein [Tannerellaceae bacterium]